MKRKFKISVIFLFLVLLCISISAISAQTIENDNLTVTDDNSQVILNSQENIQPMANESSISPLDKFVDDIDNAKRGETVYLTGDIVTKDTINVYEDITIDGQNHVIDGAGSHQILYTNSKLTLKNIIFKNGKASDASGGAIYNRGELTINNCQFINNKAYNGGAIDSYGIKLTVSNSKFTQNSASDSGGAILTHTGSQLTVNNCNFDKNTAIATSHGTRGGAICCFGASKITSTTFTNNVCKAVASGKTPSKSKQSLGGALYLLEATHYITSCTFNANSVDNDGGAIFAYCDVSKLSVSKSKFTNNNAYYEDGGAISSCARNLQITGSTFTGNYAYEDGGAIDTYSFNGKPVKVTIDGCVFKNNKGYKSAGAIYMGIKTQYTLKNSKFIGNKGTVAGALYVEPSCKATITKCTFTKNAACNVAKKVVYSKSKAVVKHSGGAIYTKSKSLTISKCSFDSNKGTYGGAICNHAKVTVKSCKFTKNSASDSGGAYFHDKGTATFKKNTFKSNKAKKAGGAIYFKSGKLKTAANKYSKNKAKFGAKFYSKKSIKIK